MPTNDEARRIAINIASDRLGAMSSRAERRADHFAP
jgi:hypothetical protein